jgi:hypothetical protein
VGTRAGGAIREGDEAGFDGGAMPFVAGGAMRLGFGGGCIEKLGVGFEARCAEFKAGNEGGGRLSSSSPSSELWCSSSVKEGMAGAFALTAVAFGVVAGDNSCKVMLSSGRSCDSARCCVVGTCGSPPFSSCCDLLGVVGAAEPGAGAK